MADPVRIHAGRKPFVWVAPEDLSPERLRHFHLYLGLSQTELSFAVLNPTEARFEAAGIFRLDSGNLLQELDSIVAETTLLRQEYQVVAATYFNQWSTLVPLALFKAEEQESYLNFNLNLPESAEVHYDRLQNSDICNVYVLEKDCANQLKRLFPKMTLLHHTSVSIDLRLLLHKNDSASQVFLHFLKDHFEILVTSGKQLIFHNSFSWSTPEDIAYYLLFTAEQLQLPANQLRPHISGELPLNSPVFELLKPYVKELQFATHPKGYQFAKAFENIPEHYLFHPLHLLLCV